jgi:hypothetical protein
MPGGMQIGEVGRYLTWASALNKLGFESYSVQLDNWLVWTVSGLVTDVQHLQSSCWETPFCPVCVRGAVVGAEPSSRRGTVGAYTINRYRGRRDVSQHSLSRLGDESMYN